MNEKDDFNQFLPETNLDKDKLSVEIPPEPSPIPPERIPSGYEPMGEIQLRGRVFGGFAGGRAPWWVMISAWALFGGLALLLLHFVIKTASFTLIILLVFTAIILFILARGTAAKLSSRNSRG